MHRLFVALRLPAPIRAALAPLMAGVPGASWQDDAQLHLTLRFVGEVERRAAEDVALALDGIAATGFALRLAGVGAFGPGDAATTLWAGVVPNEPLRALAAKAERAVRHAGLPPARRVWHPHVTVARLSRSDGRHPAVHDWQVRHAGFATPTFAAAGFALYESRLGRDGASYAEVACWPLSPP